METTSRTAVALLLAAASGNALGQQDLFLVNATSDDGTVTLSIGGNSLPDLVNDLADQEIDFASLDGLAFSASVTYAGVENAIVVAFDPDGGGPGVETIDIELTGVDVDIPEFVDGAGGEDLGEQLEDFFLVDNPELIGSFQASLNRLSPIAVGDGNPVSTTARSANYKFNRFGMFQDGTPTSAMVDRRFRLTSGGLRITEPELSPATESLSFRRLNDFRVSPVSLTRGAAAVSGGSTLAGGAANAAAGSDGRFAGGASSGSASYSSQAEGSSVGWFRSRVDVSASTFDVDGGNLRGFDIAVAPSWETSYGDSFSLVLGLPFAYHEVEGAQVYNAGVHLDAPIRLIKPTDSDGVAMLWQVTPGGSVDIGASYDFAAGGVVYSYGVTNLFGFSFGDIDLLLPTAFYLYDSVPIQTADIEFDSGIEQEIFKQGVKVVYHPGDRFQLFGGVTYTDFLQDAAIDNYWSPVAGLGWMFQNGATINLSYEGDIDPSDRFERHGARLAINIPF
ncbi:MAG: hypothetical protein AAF108_12000 [Planctomycetota bacterium]